MTITKAKPAAQCAMECQDRAGDGIAINYVSMEADKCYHYRSISSLDIMDTEVMAISLPPVPLTQKKLLGVLLF